MEVTLHAMLIAVHQPYLKSVARLWSNNGDDSIDGDDDDDGDCGDDEVCFVCWLLVVPATCECISGTDLHRQFYVLPH